MMRKSASIAAMIFLLGTGLAGAKETVKIGLISPLTGDVKTFGESSRNAFYIALEEYGKTGKYTISPFIVDDRNDPTEGANGALKLITQDKVRGFCRSPDVEGLDTGERDRHQV